MKSSKAPRGKVKAVRPQGPQGPAAAEVANAKYASKVKDWRKNRFQKDRVDVQSGDAVFVKASKKRKKAAPAPVPVTSKGSQAKSAKAKASEATVDTTPGQDVSPVPKAKKKRTGGSTKGRAEELREGTGVISEMKFQSLKLHESLRRQLEYLNFRES